MRRLILGGVTSGVGKTTLACALLAAFRRRELRVQPFKIGPDYIDPSHHTLAAGRPSRTLDSVLLPPDSLRELFARAAGNCDLALAEGVMGLFDGRNGRGEEGSTAHIAKLLQTPIVVVIDVAKTSRTAGAIALGCLRFDPQLPVAGWILNRVGSPTHARWATEAVESATGLPVFGSFPREPELGVPERHLGLVPTEESGPDDGFYDHLAAAAEEHLSLGQILTAAECSPLSAGTSGLFPSKPIRTTATIAIARDRAFNFYYEDSLDLLRAWGAELLPFSPLKDEKLPEGSRGVYIGGGFPEMYAAELAENKRMHVAIFSAAHAGLPIYAECGGLMYLGRSLTGFEGRLHPMVGITPLESRMQKRRVTLGYRSVRALRASPVLPAGSEARGHEFHYSELSEPVPTETAAYSVQEKDGAPEGYSQGNVLTSYVHLHFGSDPSMACRFVQRCAVGVTV